MLTLQSIPILMTFSALDQLNNNVSISFPPKRIVSLVPSLTELLYSLGLNEEVVGITKFCIHPYGWYNTKRSIGGTKTVNKKTIIDLQPDLIIANKEENVKEQIEELKEIAPVWVSDIKTLEDALEMIRAVGSLVNRSEIANEMAVEILRRFKGLEPLKQRLKTAYLIWKSPYMAAATDTFINDMMARCGFENIFLSESRYPKISIDQLSMIDCQLLLLSSEPYPFKQKHIDELQQQLPKTKILLVDGEMFSWYGSRLLLVPEYLQRLISQAWL